MQNTSSYTWLTLLYFNEEMKCNRTHTHTHSCSGWVTTHTKYWCRSVWISVMNLVIIAQPSLTALLGCIYADLFCHVFSGRIRQRTRFVSAAVQMNLQGGATGLFLWLGVAVHMWRLHGNKRCQSHPSFTWRETGTVFTLKHTFSGENSIQVQKRN